MDLDEVFDYAIEQEIKAKEFYESSAARTDNAEAAALFRSLARMEAAHRRALENEKAIIADSGAFEPLKYDQPSADEEMMASLKKMTGVLREANVELTDKHSRVQAELEAAGRIQEALLPRKAPQLPGLSISVSCSMAEQVGGDYYDFLLTPRGSLAFTIADVSGKGLPAAMLMMAMRTLWRAKIREDESPRLVLRNIGIESTAELQQNDQFVTMITAVYDIASHRLTFANGGHWPPLVYFSDSADFTPMPSGRLPIGLDESGDYADHTIELQPGSIVLFYSDGILDAAGPEGDRFGEARLRQLVLGSKGLGSDEIRDAVAAAVFEFSRGRQQDDQTLIVLKRTQ